jgi:leader peptidase (prepilin peptidase)/N-methyltransferase
MIPFYCIIFILGLILGSFFNVVIHRLPREESIVRPRSRCPRCGTPIHFYDNVPLLSYALLKGRCRSCGAPISIQYPLIELGTAIALVAVAIRYGFSEQTLIFGVLILFLIPIAVIDFHTRLILNKLTLPGLIAGTVLICLLAPERWKEIPFGALGGGLILLFFALIGKWVFKKESIGMGDVKLVMMVGAFLGFPEVWIAFYFGAAIAMVYILSGLIFKRIRFGDMIPFGPFIALGTVVFVLWGDSIERIVFHL